VRQKVRAEGVM